MIKKATFHVDFAVDCSENFECVFIDYKQCLDIVEKT